MQDISIISMIFTAALVLICLFLVLVPFFTWNTQFDFAAKFQENVSLKESLLTTLNELEFEYKMDKISHTDYKNLKRQYEAQIAGIMREEEEKLNSNKIDHDLMAEVESEIEETIRSYKNTKGEEK